MSKREAVVVGGLLLVLSLTVSQAGVACPWHKSQLLYGQWAPTVGGQWPAETELWRASPFAVADAGGISVPVDAPAGEVGTWSEPISWPVIAIHGALLPTGEVLHYSYPSGGAGSNARTWDPVSGAFTDVSMNTDIFCSGLSQLDDGHLYATGGNDYGCDFQGRSITHEFDPFSGTWTELGHMQVRRWYPQNVTLADGRVIIVSGLDVDCDTTPVMELYDPSSGLSEVPEGNRITALYPRLYLLNDGRIAHVGPEADAYLFELGQGWSYVDTMNTGSKWDGSAVRVPGTTDEFLAIGGSDFFVQATAERIDFSDPDPQWRTTASMNFARSHANAVILPDRRVLVIGGGTFDLYGDPVLNAEIYDPDAETWTLLPAQVHGRMYHSTAILLPDGRVISAGQDSGLSGFYGEIYSPDYLFRGPRPVIASAPTEVAYGQAFEVESPQAGEIASMALLRLPTVTHSVDNGQQYVGLDFSVSGGDRLTAISPQHGNLAPPGYYMLFLLDGDGVPSEATMLLLTAPDIDLDVSGLTRGESSTWTVTGAQPGEEVRFVLGAGGLGAGPCPGAMGGECLDLLPPIIQLGSAFADGSGTASLEIVVPGGAPLVETGSQAVILRGPGGVDTVKSNAVIRQLLP